MRRSETITYGLKMWLITVILFANFKINAQTLTVSGSNWNVNLPTINEAGTNYGGTYESASNQILLNVSVPLLLGNGKISIHYEHNPLWHNSLKIEARKTGNGTGLCGLCSISPSGTSTYQQVTLSDIELFRITAVLSLASVSNIPIQLKLSGVSVALPVENYSAKIVFTIGPL